MKKLAYLDGLRGIAALIVVFHHLILMFYPTLNFGDENNSAVNFFATTPLNIFYNGDFAVCLFFVLSGYVLSYKYIYNNDPKILVGYAIKRYFRLLPLIAASIIFSVVFIRLNLIHTSELNTITRSGDWLLDLFKCDISFEAVIKNIFYGVLFLGENQYNPVVWSMKVEFIGSMLLFAFLLLNHKIKPKWVLLSLVFITAAYFGFYYYIAFLTGYGLCYLNKLNKFQLTSFPLKIGLVLLGILFASFPAAWKYWDRSMYAFMNFKGIDLYSLYHVIGAGIFVFLILQDQVSKKILSIKPILFLGKISFPLYLFHLLFLVLVEDPIFLFLFPSLGYHLAFFVSVLCVFPFILIISFFAYRFIDKPTLQLTNKFERWFLTKLVK